MSFKRSQPAIGNVPATIKDTQTRAFLQSLRDAVQTFQGGRTGSAELDRAVTVGELLGKGFKFNGDRTVIARALANVGKGGLSDAEKEVIERPTIPAGFEVTVGWTSASLHWEEPTYKGHSYTEIFRQRTNLNERKEPVDHPQFNERNLFAVSVGNVYSDKLEYNSGYYYWVRHVNKLGQVGPIQSTEGTFVKTRRTMKEEVESAGMHWVAAVDGVPKAKGESNTIYDERTGRLLFWNESKGKYLTIAESTPSMTEIADQINPVRIKPSIPAKNEGDHISYNGRLYRWDGNKYVIATVDATQLPAGIVTADKLASNSVVAAKIAAGAVGADQIAADAVSTKHLAIGSGVNLLTNPLLSSTSGASGVTPFGWSITNKASGASHTSDTVFKADRDSWLDQQNFFLNENAVRIQSYAKGAGRCIWMYQDVYGLDAGKKYVASAWVAGHRCTAEIVIEELDLRGNYRRAIGNSSPATKSMRHSIEQDGDRLYAAFTAPSSGNIRFAILGENPTGDNQVVFLMRPMLEKWLGTSNDVNPTPSQWVNSGMTVIDGGQIITNSITSAQMSAGFISAYKAEIKNFAAEQISASTISGDKITATDTLWGNLIRGKRITAETAKVANSLTVGDRVKIDGNGIEIYGRGRRENKGLVITNDYVAVYDMRGRLRAKMGKLR